MKHLILGSSGQIGAALKQFLIIHSESVDTLDIQEGEHEDLRYYSPYIESKFIEADIIYFLAYDVGGSRYLSKNANSTELLHNNSRIMDVVFSLIKKHNKKFIFASSQMSNMTHSPYGVCKSLGEHYTKNLNGRIVHFWNVYGYERDTEKFHVITDFILKAKQNKKIDMLTTGEEKRQFLHAADCSEALYIIANNYDKYTCNSPLHITSFEWSSIKEVADIIASYYPGTEVIPGTKNDEVQKNTMNEPDSLILQDWQPRIDLQTGIKTIIDCYE